MQSLPTKPFLTLDELRIAQMTDEVRERDPKLWQLVYPRIYHEPKHGRYYSPKDVGTQLAEVALKIRNGYRGEAEMYEYQFASAVVKYRVPMFWIAHHLMEAMAHTAPPSDFPWMTMPVPFDAAIFMIPRGTLRHADEGEAEWIGYARFKAGHEELSKLAGGMFGILNGGMILVAKTEAGLFHHWNMPQDSLDEYITLADIDEYKNDLAQHNCSTGFATYEVTANDNLFFVEVAHYIFSTLLIMMERPMLVETGSMLKRVSKRGETKEFWSPNVVGSNYRVRSVHGPTLGTHASPRLHWVRGFWRQQVYGPNRSLRKPVLIDPFLRGE